MDLAICKPHIISAHQLLGRARDLAHADGDGVVGQVRDILDAFDHQIAATDVDAGHRAAIWGLHAGSEILIPGPQAYRKVRADVAVLRQNPEEIDGFDPLIRCGLQGCDKVWIEYLHGFCRI
ncbi:hypothetical protein [Paracoccus sp. (in: a-proteobacteria)]|uniref:hypothetical protein n=1 Tax=Paracoccus sp. TaxID=267 RepID=UPI0028A7D836|nr:hypothetical protein [Paracoccus sp. (in: a-proteobacteria)]